MHYIAAHADLAPAQIESAHLVVAARAAHINVKSVGAIAAAVAAGQLHLPHATVAVVVDDHAGRVHIRDIVGDAADNVLVGEVRGQVDLSQCEKRTLSERGAGVHMALVNSGHPGPALEVNDHIARHAASRTKQW